VPNFGPISRSDLVRALHKAGFEGPYPGGKHQHMLKGNLTLIIPNPHKGDIGRALLLGILTRAGISREEWEKL